MSTPLKQTDAEEPEEVPDGDLPVLEEAWRNYQRQLRAKPLQTKALTAGVISAIGQIIASSMRPPPTAGEPSRLRSTASFFLFGLVINGPFFHWWYSALERICQPHPSTTAPGIAYRLVLDRLMATPPFLAVTLAGLHWLQNCSAKRAASTMKQLFWGALFMNWKVWSVAQIINFKYVPVPYRVIFGNLVALWWNIYLSIIQQRKPKAN